MTDHGWKWRAHAVGASEPSLDEMLKDPIVRSVMTRDNVSLDDMRDIVTHARARIIARELMDADAGASFDVV